MKAASATKAAVAEEVKWERRPGGMLVQKRDAVVGSTAIADLSLRVYYGALRFQISINSQATFGELKKAMVGESGLEAGEQILEFRGKERRNEEFLDRCGVKNRSKLLLTEDPHAKERRLIQMRLDAKIQSAHRAITRVSIEVDGLADQVWAIEKSIKKGHKVAEVQITTLIELLMRQAVRLETVTAQGDHASAQKTLQEKRIHRCVEALDVLKVSNTRIKPVVVTTKWETFESSLTQPHWDFLNRP